MSSHAVMDGCLSSRLSTTTLSLLQFSLKLSLGIHQWLFEVVAFYSGLRQTSQAEHFREPWQRLMTMARGWKARISTVQGAWTLGGHGMGRGRHSNHAAEQM